MSDILSVDFQNNDSARKNTSRVGQLGEELAARFLRENGFRLVAANFKTQIGRNIRGAAVSGEIDLIALDGKILCFVEVKTRSSDEYAAPIAAVDLRKQRQIIRAARVYRKIFNIKTAFRYDAISVVLCAEKPEIQHFKNFWTEAKFRKRSWNY